MGDIADAIAKWFRSRLIALLIVASLSLAQWMFSGESLTVLCDELEADYFNDKDLFVRQECTELVPQFNTTNYTIIRSAMNFYRKKMAAVQIRNDEACTVNETVNWGIRTLNYEAQAELHVSKIYLGKVLKTMCEKIEKNPQCNCVNRRCQVSVRTTLSLQSAHGKCFSEVIVWKNFNQKTTKQILDCSSPIEKQKREQKFISTCSDATERKVTMDIIHGNLSLSRNSFEPDSVVRFNCEGRNLIVSYNQPLYLVCQKLYHDIFDRLPDNKATVYIVLIQYGGIHIHTSRPYVIHSEIFRLKRIEDHSLQLVICPNPDSQTALQPLRFFYNSPVGEVTKTVGYINVEKEDSYKVHYYALDFWKTENIEENANYNDYIDLQYGEERKNLTVVIGIDSTGDWIAGVCNSLQNENKLIEAERPERALVIRFSVTTSCTFSEKQQTFTTTVMITWIYDVSPRISTNVSCLANQKESNAIIDVPISESFYTKWSKKPRSFAWKTCKTFQFCPKWRAAENLTKLSSKSYIVRNVSWPDAQVELFKKELLLSGRQLNFHFIRVQYPLSKLCLGISNWLNEIKRIWSSNDYVELRLVLDLTIESQAEMSRSLQSRPEMVFHRRITKELTSDEIYARVDCARVADNSMQYGRNVQLIEVTDFKLKTMPLITWKLQNGGTVHSQAIEDAVSIRNNSGELVWKRNYFSPSSDTDLVEVVRNLCERLSHMPLRVTGTSQVIPNSSATVAVELEYAVLAKVGQLYESTKVALSLEAVYEPWIYSQQWCLLPIEINVSLHDSLIWKRDYQQFANFTIGRGNLTYHQLTKPKFHDTIAGYRAHFTRELILDSDRLDNISLDWTLVNDVVSIPVALIDKICELENNWTISKNKSVGVPTVIVSIPFWPSHDENSKKVLLLAVHRYKQFISDDAKLMRFANASKASSRSRRLTDKPNTSSSTRSTLTSTIALRSKATSQKFATTIVALTTTAITTLPTNANWTNSTESIDYAIKTAKTTMVMTTNSTSANWTNSTESVDYESTTAKATNFELTADYDNYDEVVISLPEKNVSTGDTSSDLYFVGDSRVVLLTEPSENGGISGAANAHSHFSLFLLFVLIMIVLLVLVFLLHYSYTRLLWRISKTSNQSSALSASYSEAYGYANRNELLVEEPTVYHQVDMNAIVQEVLNKIEPLTGKLLKPAVTENEAIMVNSAENDKKSLLSESVMTLKSAWKQDSVMIASRRVRFNSGAPCSKQQIDSEDGECAKRERVMPNVEMKMKAEQPVVNEENDMAIMKELLEKEELVTTGDVASASEYNALSTRTSRSTFAFYHDRDAI